MAAQEEVKRKRKLAKELLYPFLLKHSTSIEEADLFCQSVEVAIKQAFNNQMRKQKVSDLKIHEFIKEGIPDYEKWSEILGMFADESVSNAVEIIGGMTQAIESFKREEMFKRPLSSLKTEFLE